MDLVERIRRLVAIESVSAADPRLDRSNRGVVDQVAEWAEELGFRCEIVPVDYHESKANLVATLGEGEGGLVLAGHGDTVPYDEGAWRSDPFTLTERDGRLYGLGAADMKGAIACMLHAASAFRPSSVYEPLRLVVTADEECTMGGAKALAAAGKPRARAAVIGEPTSLTPIRMHKGSFQEAVRLTGRSGHSSDPSLGASALEGMADVLEELRALRTELQSRHREDAFDVPVPTLNLGHVEGGDSPNRICASAELRFDVRPIPGMPDNASLRAMIHDRIRRRLEGSGLRVEFQPLFEGIPPFETPSGSTLVRLTERLTGTPARSVMFATESPFFRELGMDVVVLGPGDIAVAHQPDEFVPADSLPAAVDLYRQLIQRFCVEAHGS